MSVALLFSPQGSQSVGMGRDLAERHPAAAAVWERADAALGWSVSDTSWSGPEERLNDTRQTQPALLTTSAAALAALSARHDPRPAFVAGHSVGEYAALVAAGALPFEDALRLVALRGRLMAEAAPDGGMSAVIGLDRPAVAAAIADATDLVVANDNAPGQVVISGSRGALADAEAALKAAGAKRVIPLNVSGPFHSPVMADVGAALAEAFADAGWREPRVPVVSNVTAEPVGSASELRALLARQVSSPVEWVRSIERMRAEGVDVFVELGAGSALAGMVRRIAPEATALAVADAASLDASLEVLAGAGASVS